VTGSPASGSSSSSPGTEARKAARSAIHRAIEVVGERDGEHPAGGIVLRAPEVEARLHAARPVDRQLRLGQIHLMRGQDELGLRRQRVGELEVDRRAVSREI
jgi:hypothetical protein